jgi:hypothetical protein
MSDHKSITDKWLIRAKDISLIISFIVLFSYIMAGSRKIFAWDNAVILANKSFEDIIEINKTLVVQTAMLLEIKDTVKQISRNQKNKRDLD